jgi:outer membrane receptor protein involved in Fe transport
VFVTTSVFAQQYSISGAIFDTNNQAVAYANIVLIQVQDSTVLKGTTSDDFGKFKINEIEAGSYTIKISFIGYENFSQNISVENDIDLKTIVLKESTESLNEVALTYKKPTLKKEADRLIFNVENSALAEGTVLQVLKSTPGVLVLDNSISVKGSEPAVYINNRKVNLNSDELVQLLENSSANGINSVEVITNPSAKYDADSGVVLNIVMSKNRTTGYRGSIFTNYTQGVFPRYNVGTSHFFKNSKLNFNLNYSYTTSKINRDEDKDVNFLGSNNSIEQIWKAKEKRNTWSETHNLGFNFDYSIDDNNTLSLSSAMLYLPYYKSSIINNTVITNENFNFLSRFEANSSSTTDKYNLGFDLDYIHNFKKGQLSINSHYTTYNYEIRQGVNTNYFNQSNVFNNLSAFNTNSNQDTKITTSKVDYSLPLNETSTFEVGAKYSNINTDSDITQFDIDNNTGNEVIDPLNSDIFNYNEDVFAFYSNYGLDTDKWSLSVGLRGEQTDIKGVSISNNETNTQNFLKWFPNASIQYNLSDKFNLYANYKRSITRPNFTDLNPFEFFLNESYVVTGNPDLLPSLLDHYVVGTTLFNIFTIEAYYQKYDGKISELPRQDNSTNIVSFTPVNLDKTIEFGFDFAVYFNINKNWNTYFVTSFYNIEEETNFGNGIVKQDQWSNYTELTNNFSFLKDKSLSANLTLTWVGKNLQGLQTVGDRLVSEFSITKTVLKKNGVISLAISDVFNEQDFEIRTRYLNQNNSNIINLDNRYIKLGFRCKFGNTRLKTNESIKGQEELKRLEEKHN